MRRQTAALALLVSLAGALPVRAEPSGGPAAGRSGTASPTVISQDPLTRQIILSLTKPNGGVRSFTATANAKTIELLPGAADPLAPLKPAEGLVKADKVKVDHKSKKTTKAYPQLSHAADKGL